MNVIVQIVSNSVTGMATFNGNYVGLNPVTGNSTSPLPLPRPAARWSWANGCGSCDRQFSETTDEQSHQQLTPLVCQTPRQPWSGVSLTISEPTQFTLGTVTAISANRRWHAYMRAPAPGVLNGISVNNIVCTIANLGGNLKGGTPLTAPQWITVTVGITAPNAAIRPCKLRSCSTASIH